MRPLQPTARRFSAMSALHAQQRKGRHSLASLRSDLRPFDRLCTRKADLAKMALRLHSRPYAAPSIPRGGNLHQIPNQMSGLLKSLCLC